MAKIDRYDGNLKAFASESTGTNRTLFGEITQSNDLTDQITPDFLLGWEIVGPSDQPTLEDFNAAMYTNGQLLAYLHQAGVPEWNASQEYHIGSIANASGVLYRSLTNTNVGNAPASSPANWAESANLLNTTRLDVASAANVDLTSSAADTRHINITGTTTITGFIVTVGQCYFVRFAAALTLTNGASLVTQTGANIVTTAGDTCIIRATAANTVELLCYVETSKLIDTTRIDVASSSTVNLTSSAPSTRHINITGTTTVNGFTVAAGRCYFVRFNAALTLTNGASLVTQSGSDITTAAGDTCLIRATAANVVEILCYTPSISGRKITVRDVKTTGTNGGSLTLGGWRTRDLNTAVVNQITGASLSSNQITLPPGNYYISGQCRIGSVSDTRLRLFNITGAATLLEAIGRAGVKTGNLTSSSTPIDGPFTVSATAAIELQIWSSASEASTGNGHALSIGTNEVFTDLTIWRL